MVDSIFGVGSAQSLDALRQTKLEAQRKEKASEERQASRAKPTDEVVLSQQALDRISAEKAAQDVRVELEQKKDVSLGADRDFEE